jgi:ParB-like chromosome segregation protein Spo0J
MTLEDVENKRNGMALDGLALDGLRMIENLPSTPEEADTQPRRVPFGQIETAAVFNSRDRLDEQKLAGLVQVLAAGGKLPALTVLRRAGRTFLVDGHYRLEAWRLHAAKNGRGTNFAVPVSVFCGSPADAVFASVQTNSQHGLALTTSERTDAAWKLVLIGEKNRTEMTSATAVSRAWLGKMRKVKATLGEDAADFPSWPRAMREAEGRTAEPPNEDDIMGRKMAIANKLTDRVTQAIGGEHADDPVLMAMVIENYMGRRIVPLIQELQHTFREELAEAAAAELDAEF